MGGHAKCLLLMTRGEGGSQKPQKPAYVIAWMFPKKEVIHKLYRNWGLEILFVLIQQRVKKELHLKTNDLPGNCDVNQGLAIDASFIGGEWR